MCVLYMRAFCHACTLCHACRRRHVVFNEVQSLTCMHASGASMRDIEHWAQFVRQPAPRFQRCCRVELPYL